MPHSMSGPPSDSGVSLHGCRVGNCSLMSMVADLLRGAQIVHPTAAVMHSGSVSDADESCMCPYELRPTGCCSFQIKCDSPLEMGNLCTPLPGLWSEFGVGWTPRAFTNDSRKKRRFKKRRFATKLSVPWNTFIYKVIL